VPDLDAIIAATREAADLAHRHWREGALPDAKVWEKSKGHPVCDMDLAVDQLLQKRLGTILPDAAWLSEETVDDSERLNAQQLWVVDPIDGTRDYVRGRSGWCVSVALIENGAPVFAVMAAPAQGKLWVAQAGNGTTCNDERLTASNCQDIIGARVPTDELPKIDLVRGFVQVEKPNSIAMRMTMVACDRADLVATLRWGHEWDIAAAHLVAQEAGAMVTNATGKPITYNKRSPVDFGLLCSAPAIHDAAVERFSEAAQRILNSADR
jgi:myo-inositol-1(or 4)-monophosphatase